MYLILVNATGFPRKNPGFPIYEAFQQLDHIFDDVAARGKAELQSDLDEERVVSQLARATWWWNPWKITVGFQVFSQHP